MQINQLIVLYESKNSDLKEAIENGDESLVTQCDLEVKRVFDEIVGLDPADSDTLTVQIKYLLDFLYLETGQSVLASRVKAKILRNLELIVAEH